MVRIKDSFEIKAKYNLGRPPGVVVVFEVPMGEQIPTVGAEVVLRRPDGRALHAQVGEVKDHGSLNASLDGKSFFFEGLTLADAPVGTELLWCE